MKRNNNRRKRGSSSRKKTNRRGNSAIVGISRVRSSPSDQLVTLDFPMKTQKISLSGSSTFSFTMEVDSPGDILENDASTIVGKFAGWRITRVTANFIPLSATQGSSVFWFSDDNYGVPTDFKSYRHKTYPNSFNASTGYFMSWRPRDYRVLDFNPPAMILTEPLINLLGHTNLTDLGTPSSTVDLWCVTGTVTVQMKGLSI